MGCKEAALDIVSIGVPQLWHRPDRSESQGGRGRGGITSSMGVLGSPSSGAGVRSDHRDCRLKAAPKHLKKAASSSTLRGGGVWSGKDA
eukprot:1179959-Prorocentrum_minimum.AAC.3